ncbi:MAG: transglutaminase family protein [Galactobacter sp.]
MARLRITHTIDFDYESQIAASYNEVRVSPHAFGEQMLLQHRVSVDPAVRMRESVDCFGTRVHEFEIQQPHDGLSVRADSTVVVTRPDHQNAERISLKEVTRRSRLDLILAESLICTPLTAAPDEVAELASGLLDRHDVGSSALAIAKEVASRIEYVPGVTTVHSKAEEVWDQGKGVCQDMAHVVIGALRAVGIPARYVSGYLHPSTAPEVGVTVKGEAHAWIEYYAGSWLGFDPTTTAMIGERYVMVGHGRDYRDVPPVRGVYDGVGGSKMDATVEITLL